MVQHRGLQIWQHLRQAVGTDRGDRRLQRPFLADQQRGRHQQPHAVGHHTGFASRQGGLPKVAQRWSPVGQDDEPVAIQVAERDAQRVQALHQLPQAPQELLIDLTCVERGERPPGRLDHQQRVALIGHARRDH